MNTAVIDLGTNTFNLLIGRVENGEIVAEHRSKISVKIGAGGFLEKKINEPAFSRGLVAISKHLETIEKYEVRQVLAFATSAVRDASNGQSFVDEIYRKFGVKVAIISGDREAELICAGVQASAYFGEEPLLIMDIGGGSTEFIIAGGSAILWKESYPLGVSRILEMLSPEDPISENDLNELNGLLENSLGDLSKALKEFPTNHLVGSSGSFDTLSELILQGKYQVKTGIKGNRYDFRLEDYRDIHEVLLKSTLEERLQMPGMLEMRAEMMVISSAIIDYIIRVCSINQMTLSTFALKEGVLVTQDERN